MTAARPKACMPARRCATPLTEPYSSAWPPSDLLSRPFVKKFVNPPRRFGTDAFDLHQVADRGALDGFQRAEVMQQCAFARRSDAGDDRDEVGPRRFVVIFPPPLRGRKRRDRSLDRSRERISTLDAVSIKL